MPIPYLPQSWFDGSGGGTPINAARLNGIEAGIRDAHYMPAVRVFHNANQSIPGSTNTALAFNSERFDTASNAADTQHDTVTNNSHLTCRYAGIYSISGNAAFAVGSLAGVRELQIRLNGATVIGRARGAISSAAYESYINVSCLYSLAVSEYIELVAFQDSGGALNVVVGSNYSPEFSMVRVA